jgi:hypothetical protein
MPQSFQPDDALMIQWEPMLSYGLRADQVQAFFAPEDPNLPPALNTSLRYNRAFGTPGIVNLTFGVNGETVTAIKNVVYWPALNYPGEQPNKNPTLGDPNDPTVPQIHFYSHRDETTGNPDLMLSDHEMPIFSISHSITSPGFRYSDFGSPLNAATPETVPVETTSPALYPSAE